MRKTLTLVLAVALFGILTAVVVAQVGDDPTAAGPAATTETTETTESAPTQTTPERTTTTEDNPQGVGTETVEDVDISGPCDEAEHAGDPRCNGTVDEDHDRGDDRDHDRGEDNSGPDARRRRAVARRRQARRERIAAAERPIRPPRPPPSSPRNPRPQTMTAAATIREGRAAAAPTTAAPTTTPARGRTTVSTTDGRGLLADCCG